MLGLQFFVDFQLATSFPPGHAQDCWKHYVRQGCVASDFGHIASNVPFQNG